MKVANVRKDNYNINIMENFPMDIEIGPKVRINLVSKSTEPLIPPDGPPVSLPGDRSCSGDQRSAEWSVWIRKDLQTPSVTEAEAQL